MKDEIMKKANAVKIKNDAFVGDGQHNVYTITSTLRLKI